MKKNSLLARVDRLAFERLLAELASRFADVAPASVAAEIERALGQLVEFFGYDRCTYGEFDAGGTLNVVCSAASPGIPAHKLGPLYHKDSWFVGELLAGRAVVLPALPKGLPGHARQEAAMVKRIGLRSHLSIPLHVRGRTTGVLAFAGLRRARDWPKDLITRLTIIAQVFASAAARARSEDEAERLRSRLWHADRVARVGALSAAIAHEINQPLAAILANAQAGLAELGRGETRAEALRPILEAVVRDDKRAAGTIRSMRALLRREEGSRSRIDLASTLHGVLGLLAAEFGRNAVRVEARLEPGCRVTADKTQIEQLALNLLLNAVEAMAAIGREARLLSLSAAPTGDGRIAVEVRDSGPGIAAAHLEKVFEPFWTTRKDGLGLGLAICRSIVEAHDGTIAAVPNAGGGVTFRFDLVAETAAGDAEIPAAGDATPGPARDESAAPAGTLVCVIDDDDSVRESLVRLLSAEGWPAASYASADEFLRRQGLAAVGCILLDQQMPGMSGLELQQQLAGYGAAPPVVFLTGHGDLAAGVHAMKLGALDFLAKPVEAGVLREAVRKALARHAAQRERSRSREAMLARLGRLSAREREVMTHVVRGRLNKQIAADLDIALQTVKQHRSRVMVKMEADSVAELVRVCEAAGDDPVLLR